MTVALTQGATATSRVAAVIPFDAEFARRTDAMLRLRRMLDGKSRLLHDRLTQLARERPLLKLRALDARLSGETYRSIAQVLSAQGRVLEGRSWKTHCATVAGSGRHWPAAEANTIEGRTCADY